MRFALLDPLRGLAALWVFCFHLGFSEEFQHKLPWIYQILRHGELGVPMFFVISGFCITAAACKTLETGRTPGDFMKRRAWRIYPPFWCSIAVTVAVPFVIEFLSSLKTGTYTAPSASHLNYGFLTYSVWDWLRLTTLVQVFQYVPEATSLQYKFTTINAVYWTLAIEVQFYLAMAAAVATGRFYAATLWLITAAAIASQWVPGAGLSGLFLPYWPMFAVGIAVYWIIARLQFPKLGPNPVVRSIAAILATALVIALLTLLTFEVSLLPIAFAAGFGVFLLALNVFDEPYAELFVGSRFRAIRIAAWLTGAVGAMSYSLYLLHGRLRFLAMQPLRQFFPENSIAFDVSVIGLTSLMCYAFYLCCERPFIPGAKSRATVRGPLPATAVSATIPVRNPDFPI
ncbi:acyltransferase family protein [Planctellipticum variicoloris]|uniref:acyltransferase family protein n=1 Tax=Planctellipticum variicoloris TaxID=3064265 RepID=UPI00301364DF|nr:acyltransferase [Planctomycetaceae bacterium SH412]